MYPKMQLPVFFSSSGSCSRNSKLTPKAGHKFSSPLVQPKTQPAFQDELS